MVWSTSKKAAQRIENDLKLHNGLRIYTIIGTRPEIIRLCDWELDVLFVNQHKDYLMSQQFLTDFSNRESANEKYLGMSRSIYPVLVEDEQNLGAIVEELKRKIEVLGKPDRIIVHGDTRTALAGALTASELKIILAHTESGVRCDDETLEQYYRIEIDKLSNYNFCPVPIAVDNLAKEGIKDGVYYTGDTMYDRFVKDRRSWDFVFVTIHRRENILEKDRLQQLIDSLKEYDNVIFPVHPHTKKKMKEFGIEMPRNVITMLPLDRKKTLDYIRDAKLVLTDSGGVQREAFWLGTPCKVARKSTEWGYYTGAFGDGNAGDKILQILKDKKPYRKVSGSISQ